YPGCDLNASCQIRAGKISASASASATASKSKMGPVVPAGACLSYTLPGGAGPLILSAQRLSSFCQTSFRFRSPNSQFLFFPSSSSRPTSVGRINTLISNVGDNAALLQDAGATAAVLIGAYGLVFGFDYLTQRGFIPQSLSRKLVHISSGLLFLAAWPIFSSSSMEARYFASLVPLVNCLRLVIHGLSLATDEGLIKSVTREGKPEGPLYYVLILIVSAVAFWRESPVGIVSLAMMCGGDGKTSASLPSPNFSPSLVSINVFYLILLVGIADIMGRRFGVLKLPYNKQKSWAGSISMFVFGFLVAIGMLYYFSSLAYFQLDWTQTIKRVALVSLLATIVESLPINEVVDDNVSVPLTT
ncbi:hypothetical protein RJ641_036374, partial [Dillenia turbinata]